MFKKIVFQLQWENLSEYSIWSFYFHNNSTTFPICCVKKAGFPNKGLQALWTSQWSDFAQMKKIEASTPWYFVAHMCCLSEHYLLNNLSDTLDIVF